MKVVLATGFPKLNNKIERTFENEFEVVSKPLYNEALEPSVSKTKADLVILSDVLEGTLELEELILLLRARHPKTRIIFIGKDISKNTKSFLYKYNVFDVINDGFTEEAFRDIVYNPRTWENVSSEFESLKNFALDENLLQVDIDNMKKIDKNEYKRLTTTSTGKKSLYQEIIPFWSTLDQTGKSFLSLNTALLLASNPDLKIILIDFNIDNPSLHLQLGFTDGDKNLSALIEDIDSEEYEINSDSFKDYLIVHPVYKNLFILPGYILNMPRKTDEELINYYEQILNFCSANNYSTILIDMASGIRSVLNQRILKSATKIFLVVNESPNALFSSKKLFDTEYGDYIHTLIGKKNLFPIINMSIEQYRKKFKIAFEITLDGQPIITFIPKRDEIHNSIFDGTPYLREPNEESYQFFFPIVDLIHPSFFKKLNPKVETNKPKKEIKKSFFPFGKNN